MNEIKPHTAELIAKMEAAWAKRLDGSVGPDVILSHNKDFIAEYYGRCEADLNKSVTGTR